MARVTEKYASDPIEQAKAQALAEYSAKKTSSVPTEIVDLPSEGRFYPKDHPLRSGKIEMRYMTAYDEDILTNASYIRNGVAIDRLLTELIVTPGVKFGDILNCDKDAMIIAARILSYGKTYDAIVTTPSDKQLKVTIDLSTLDLKTSLIEANDNGVCTFKNDRYQVDFKFLTIEQQDRVRNSDKPLFEFLIESIVSLNGETSKEKIKEHLQYNMLVSDSKELRSFIISNLPTIDLTSEFEDEHGGVFRRGFPIGSDFFYPEY
jgi:hypothetical protein